MNMEKASTQCSYYKNELHGPQLLDTAGCLIITIEYFS